MRLGHEWCGTVSRGRRRRRRLVARPSRTGDTMLGCGRCRPLPAGPAARLRRPLRDRHARRLPGALAEQLAVPVTRAAPAARQRGRRRRRDGRARRQRAARRAGAPQLAPGERAAGPRARHDRAAGGRFAPAQGVEVHLLGGRSGLARRSRAALGFARGVDRRRAARPAVRRRRRRVQRRRRCPARPLDLVEPGRRVVYIGLSGTPSQVDTRDLVLKDVTAVGILERVARAGRHDRARTPRAWSTRGRSSPRPSASTRSATCSPDTGRPAAGPAPRSTSTRGAERCPRSPSR